jgi:aryl-alcohol dehydrogenase-like predicted oxidoreductase
VEYTKLGRTGLDVSRICLGCMSYGGGSLGGKAVLDALVDRGLRC